MLIFGIIVLWSIVGFMIWGIFAACEVEFIRYAEGFEIVNPKYIYEQVQVNWFGAIMISLFLTVLSPICALGYWFYKLCTIGRR